MKINLEKKGQIFTKRELPTWADNSVLQPTPILLGNKIRFYSGFRDEAGISRIGYIDVCKDNPNKILKVSEKPVLDIGREGAFDENGIVPSIVKQIDKDTIYMYYAGYQIPKKVRMLIFSGLAISKDGGETFKRYSEVPVFERTNEDLLFRVPHSLIIENGKWKFWYGGGDHFVQGKDKTLPVYDIRYLEAKNGIEIPKNGKVVIKTRGEEHRLGRPYVIKHKEEYVMFYGYGTEKIAYQLGVAFSKNGIDWERRDNEIGIELSKEGWDSQMMAYPSIVCVDNKKYMFYNGNNYGEDGFGYAELSIEE